MLRPAIFARCSVLGLALFLLPNSGLAAPMELRWEGPADCLRAEEVRGAVTKLLRSETESFQVAVNVQKNESGYSAALAFSGSIEGTRNLSATNCDSLTRAVALIIAVSADPEASAWLSQSDNDGSPTNGAAAGVADASANAAQTSAEDPAKPTAPESETASSQKSLEDAHPTATTLHGTLGFALDAMWVPGVHFGVAGGFGVTHGPWRADLIGGYLPEFRVSAEGEAWGANVLSGSLGPRLCYLTVPALRLSLCGGLRGRYLHAVGDQSSTSEVAKKWLLTLEPGALFSWSLTKHWGFELFGVGVFPTETPSFVFSDERSGTPVVHELFKLQPGFSAEWNVVGHF